ncbi:MAG: hypothetical protein PWP07_1089 [Epulopiscium sp.]|jgi:hypothetical protein|uniref:Uncharacterized protein n=1 Tax=Defluviitalea raffinosedens TaxID=1450156 RepID=A0A7C8LCV7_9FIRM|nr:hypothetical protein [Defluviitalea raffinosedens]MBZ4667982.1 hypothetical protein [Defluviitaleaceae bacterium]MDK2787864.1 hypothetical protein [Candidatus Epulonipiscium sp.]KAE9633418.1 hypothetical protein GND95_09270 [Defluviitalea raffinosedens]MBM7687082.1 hypothetical protein [Defluviitalea raffinosedens]HHW68228.1 hypothetical protein [Candidatus Epulonipiscium sp.]
MVKRKTWGGIIILLLVLMVGALAAWIYMSFSNQPVPSKGVYVKSIQSDYGGLPYDSLYKAV